VGLGASARRTHIRRHRRPAERRLTADADGYVVDGLRFNIEPQKIEKAEWRDDSEPHTLWLVQGERSILLTPARP
jgi:hypothetical protein